MTRRERIGSRRHRANVTEHNGNQDEDGNPTYTVLTDWTTVSADWPVEMLTVRGGELLRGRQVAANTSHVFFGEFQGGKQIDPTMRMEVANVSYSIVAAFDPDGDRREMRVEAKREK